MRRCVIFNPSAKGDKARRFRQRLDVLGTGCALKLTAAPGDATRLAAEAAREGFDVVVAVGGDGTLNEVLNGLGDVPGAFERVCLGLLPLGTMNSFAREMAIPTRLDLAWQALCHGRETRLDLPCVEYDLNGARQRRYFLQLAGAGLDARAVELVRWPLKKKLGPLAYVLAGFAALRETQPHITAASDGPPRTGQLVLIGNGRFYGGPFRVFPHADMRDGLFEVCLFPRVSWLTLARCSPSLLLRHTLPAAGIRRFQAPALELSSPTRTPLEIDGEFIGHLPATLSLERSRLRVLVP